MKISEIRAAGLMLNVACGAKRTRIHAQQLACFHNADSSIIAVIGSPAREPDGRRTGGAGFIGSHVVDALLAEGWQVIVLDDLSSGNAARVADQATLDVEDVARAVMLAVGHFGVFNVATGVETDVATLYAELQRAAGTQVEPECTASRGRAAAQPVGPDAGRDDNGLAGTGRPSHRP